MIFNIQKCSIHDGNGLRTLIFFKGCPLRCQWCANPESQAYEPEIMENQGRCIGCEACIKVCPQSAIVMTGDGPRIDRKKCKKCHRCVDRCYAGAKYSIGREFGTQELYKEIEKDRAFYTFKGGGVTFSGGEPLTHPQELTAIAKACHEKGIDVAVETCGCGDYERFQSALPYINSMFFDIKHMDPDIHKELTGMDNGLILSNLKRIASGGIYTTVRTPIIPGINDSQKNLEAIARFLCTIAEIREYELLPYHQLGVSKYRALGRNYELEALEPPGDEKVRSLVRCVNQVFKDTDKVCFYIKDNHREVVT